MASGQQWGLHRDLRMCEDSEGLLTLATTLDEKRETWLEKIKEDLMEKIS